MTFFAEEPCKVVTSAPQFVDKKAEIEGSKAHLDKMKRTLTNHD